MANVRISVSKKGTLIAMIALVVLLGGGGGYLLWRVNQKDTVAPTDSSAGSCRPCRGCSTCMDHEVLIGDECCVRQPPAGRCRCCVGCSTCMDDEVMVNGNQCCTSGGTPLSNCGNTPPDGGGGGGGGGGTPACSANPVTYFLRDGTEKQCNACPSNVNEPTGRGCFGYPSPYTYECGTHCFDSACGREACNNISNPGPTVTLTYKAGAGGNIIGEATQTFSMGGDGAEVEAKPKSGFKFVKWSDGLSTAKRRERNVRESKSYTATFTDVQEWVTLTYKVNDQNGGIIEGEKSQKIKKRTGEGTSVTAKPKTGYDFTKWSDGKTTATRKDKNLDKDTTFKAVFTPKRSDAKVKLEYIAGPGGSIRGTKVQTLNKGGNGTPVTAVPDPGYYFSGWCEDETMDICVVAADSGPGGQPGTGGVTRIDTNVQASQTYWARFSGTGDSPIIVPGDSPIIVPGGTVPDTAIFDDTKDTIIFGVVILTIGITWTWVSTLPKKAYTSIKTVSKASSEYISNVKVQKERNIRESRRNRLEKRIK